MARTAERKIPLVYELVDLAILPAALLVCAKAIGMAFLNSLLGLDWSIQTIANSVFSISTRYTNQSDVVLITSYTNLFMFICIVAGCMVVTSKSVLFHHRKASPYFVLKLAKYDLLHLLKTSFHVYKEAFVWGTFLVLTTVYIALSFIWQMTFAWIAALCVMFCLTFLWIMLQNIEEDLLFHSYK